MVEFYQITIQAESAFLVPFLYPGSSFGIDRDQLVVGADCGSLKGERRVRQQSNPVRL